MVFIPQIEKKNKKEHQTIITRKRATRCSEKRKDNAVSYIVDNLLILNEIIAKDVLCEIYGEQKGKSTYNVYFTRIKQASHYVIVIKILKARGFCMFIKEEKGRVVRNESFIKNLRLFGFAIACQLELDLCYKIPCEPPEFHELSII